MTEELKKAILDAWSRDFNHAAAIMYVKNVIGYAPTEQQVIDAYTEADKEFNEWCKKK